MNVHDQRVAARRHGAARNGHDDRRIFFALHDRQAIGIELEEALRVERRLAALELRKADVAVKLAEARVCRAVRRVEGQPVDVDAVAIQNSRRERGQVAHHVAGREHRRRSHLRPSDADVVQCAPQRAYTARAVTPWAPGGA